MANELKSFLTYLEEDKLRKEQEQPIVEDLTAYKQFDESNFDVRREEYKDIISPKYTTEQQNLVYKPKTGKYTLTQLENDPEFSKVANRFLESIGRDENIFEYLRDADYSLSAAAVRSIEANKWTAEQASDYMYLREAFNNAELDGFKERFNFVKDFTVDVISDPVNILAALFAAPTLGGSLAARGALGAAAQQGVKKLTAAQLAKRTALRKAKTLKAAKTGATVGAIEGAAWAGPHEYFLQDIDVDLGARDEIDLGLIAGTTVLGGVLGGTLGGGLAGVAGFKNSSYLNKQKFKYANETEIEDIAKAQTRKEVEEDSAFEQVRLKTSQLLTKIGVNRKKADKVKEDGLNKLNIFIGNSIGKPTTQFLNRLKDSDTLQELLAKFRYDYDHTLTGAKDLTVREKSYGLVVQELHGKFLGGLQQATKKLDRVGIRGFLGLHYGNKIDTNINDQLAMMLRDTDLNIKTAEKLRNGTYQGKFRVNDELLDTYIDIKKLLNEGYSMGKESGLFLDSTGYMAGYLPRLFNYDYLLKNRDKFEDILIKAGHATPDNTKTPIKTFDKAGKEIKDDIERFAKGDRGVDVNTFGRDFLEETGGDMAEAQKLKAVQIVDDMLAYRSTPFELKSAGQAPGRSGFIQARRFKNIKDNDIAEFLENDVELVLEDYFTNLSQGIARTRLFGKSIDDFEKRFIRDTKNKTGIFYELVASGKKKGLTEKEAIKDAEAVADQLRYMHRRVTGIENPTIKNKNWAWFNDFLKLSQQMAHLPFATLSSVTEPFILFSRASSGDGFNVAKDIMTSIGKETVNILDRTVRGIQRLSGKTTKQTDAPVGKYFGINELDDKDWMELFQTGLGLEQAIQERIAGLTGEAMQTTTMKNMSNAFFKSTLLTQWTKAVQLASFTTGKRLIKQRAEALYLHKKGQKLIQLTGDKRTSTTRYYRQQLNDLGIDVDEAMAWYEKSLDKNGVFRQNLAEAQDFYGNQLTSGANRFTKEVILNPSTAEANRPLWFSNPSTQLLVQFAGYPTAFNNTVLKRWINESYQNPAQVAPKVAMTGIAMATVAHLGNTIRSSGQNYYDYETGERVDDSTLVVEAVRRFGGLGPFDYAYRYGSDAERGLTGVPALLKTFAGPLPQDVMDAFLFRRGWAELGVQNLPFYGAYDLFGGEGTRKALRTRAREFDRGPTEPKEEKRKYYYAKGGLVFNVPNVSNEPDEVKMRGVDATYNEVAGVILEDEEDRGITKQMEDLLK